MTARIIQDDWIYINFDIDYIESMIDEIKFQTFEEFNHLEYSKIFFQKLNETLDYESV